MDPFSGVRMDSCDLKHVMKISLVHCTVLLLCISALRNIKLSICQFVMLYIDMNNMGNTVLQSTSYCKI
ncbi:hypothetical protein XELAEV_18006615mg [Xenopus laevis]|uniref:Uncharacterized protein n=1 Tax=Xenopus laevis TaxID=8355 RepID=A0A974DZX3_XENLA|nr:hypothetical protein XELAEV_18006615mg [Xenopus laevis]